MQYFDMVNLQQTVLVFDFYYVCPTSMHHLLAQGHIWKLFWNVHLLMTLEFDCPDMTQCE